MRNLRFSVPALSFLMMLCVFPLSGQIENARSINVVEYMKVDPNQVDVYLELESLWRKLHRHNINKGMYQYWAMQEVLSPGGTQYDYNYVTRISFKDEAQYSSYMDASLMPSDIKDLFSDAEMKILLATNSTRQLVKREVWQLMDEMVDDDPDDEEWKYSKFNYFVINDGYTPDDFVEVQSIWSPVHEARIKDDKLEGWVVLRKLMPSGSAFQERYATVDYYKSMEALLMDDPSRYFDMLGNAEEANRKTEEGANLARQEIRKNVMDSR